MCSDITTGSPTWTLCLVFTLLLGLCDQGALGGVTQTGGQDSQSFDIGGTSYPASPDYTAVYIVSGFTADEGGTLIIFCNHSLPEGSGWFSETLNRNVPLQPSSILVDNPAARTLFSASGDTLTFTDPAPEMEGIYRCDGAGGRLRIRLTLSNPFVNITQQVPLTTRLVDTFSLTAISLYTLGNGDLQRAPDLADVTVTAQAFGRDLTIVNTTEKTPYETTYEVALPDGLVQDTLVLTVKGNIDGVGLQTANGTIQLSVEDVYERLMAVTVVEEGGEVVLNCTPTVNGTAVEFNGPTQLFETNPPVNSVWKFPAVQSNSGFYGCMVHFQITLRQRTDVIILPANRDIFFFDLNRHRLFPSHYVLLNDVRREVLRFGCIARSGTLSIISENKTITQKFAEVKSGGFFRVGVENFTVRKGDRFITIDVLLAGVYGDTLKCKSDKVSEIATVQIVPDDVYISVIPADRTSVDYGKRFNISFIFVAFVPTFEVLLNGDVIVNSSSLIRDPSINDQIYNYSINSLSLNEGLYVARRSINQVSPNATLFLDIRLPNVAISTESIVVEEGEMFSITCTSNSTVSFVWREPGLSEFRNVKTSGQFNNIITVVDAAIFNKGNYSCEVREDSVGVIVSAMTTVDIVRRCPEDYAGGIQWRATLENRVAIASCRDADIRFSIGVVVIRACVAGVWSVPNFSGCTLSSGDPQVSIIISFRFLVFRGTEKEIRASETFIKNQLDINTVEIITGRGLLSTSLEIVPGFSTVVVDDGVQKNTVHMRYTVNYNASIAGAEEVNRTRSLNSLHCNLRISQEVGIDLRADMGDTFGFQRSDFCECKVSSSRPTFPGLPIGDFNGRFPEEGCNPPEFSGFQQMCNGTTASPCMCAGMECECTEPYVGNGQLCAPDLDSDSYPVPVPSMICTDSNNESYCILDPCENVPNLDPTDSRPCKGYGEALVSCAAEPDATWGIDWPFTLAGDTAVVSCGANFTGNSSRGCLSDGIWAAPDISNCSGRVFSSIQFRIALLVAEEPDVAEVLAVLGELVNATETEAVPLFPQDLNSTINSVNEALTLLEGRLDDRNRQDVTAIFEVLDNLLKVVNVESFDLLQDGGSQRVLDNVERYGLYVARVLQQGSKNRTGTNIVLQAENVNVQMEEVDYVFPNSMEIDTMTNGRDASIVIPSELLVSRANGSDNVSVAHILFRNLQLFLPNDIEGTEPVSLVISSQVDDRGGTGVPDNALMENPVIISFSFKVAEGTDVTTDYNCVFWNFGNTTSEQSRWSPAGLETVSVTRVGDTVTVNCSSSHLTSFAVLVDVRGAQLESEALRIVSYIGLAISLACLLLTIIFFLTFGKKLFTAVHNFVHLNLAIALFIGYLVFAVGVELAKDNKIACKAVTALIQYFLLSAFCWMMCEGIMLYLMLVVVFSRLSRKWWFFMLLGWGIPVIFVAIGLGAVHDEYGVKDESGDYKYCWLSSGNGTYAIWTFVAPMLAIIIINTVFLVMVLYKIFKNRAGRRQKVNEGIKVDVVTSVVKATVILLPLLGLTWVFGLFAINENTTVFAWLFTIFNSLQGLFIFFFHVVRNDRVWGRFKKKYGEYSASKVSKSTASTGAKSSKYHSEFSSTAGMELKEKRSFADSEATEVRTTLDADEPTKVEPA